MPKKSECTRIIIGIGPQISSQNLLNKFVKRPLTRLEYAFQANLEALNYKDCSERSPNQVEFHASTEYIQLLVCPKNLNAQE